MEFSEIKFEKHRDPRRNELGMSMPGGYWVSKAWFVTTWTLICAATPSRKWTTVQTTELLCQHPEWRSLSHGDRHRMGRCVRFFVDNEMLALRLANPKKSGTRKYRPI